MAKDQTIENKATRRLLSPRFAQHNIDERLARRFEPHVRPLNEWVATTRQSPRLPKGAGPTIPWFDPEGGGVEAGVLLLFQDPSAVATFTGFISADNNDRSAHNSTVACEAAGLAPRDKVHWNIYPWWVNVAIKGKPSDPARPTQRYSEARPLAGVLFREVLALLPKVTVLVVLGNEPREALDRMPPVRQLAGRHIDVLYCPHPAARAWNNIVKSDPQGRRGSEVTTATLARAAQLIRR